MGIALLALEGLFTPLQALLAQATARRQAPAPTVRAIRGNDTHVPANDDLMLRAPTLARSSAHGSGMSTVRRPAQAHRPLRVVRVIDPKARDAGRLVISGRMADVCAELDRLAEIESRRH